jgi:hypothetical protein
MSYKLEKPSNIKVFISSLAGQRFELYSNDAGIQLTKVEINLDGYNLSNGFYLLEFETSEEKYTQKLILNR